LAFAILSRLSDEGKDFFTSYDEVYDSFDKMGLKENLLRGIYAYGNPILMLCLGVSWGLFHILVRVL